MKKYSHNDFLSLVSIFLIFGSFFCITYLTPMQCDDFWYARIGLKLEDHIRHYLTWSGRIVADYFACAILQIPSHTIISAIIALFSTGTCYLIAKIPSVINPSTKIYWWKFIVIATLYWVANPQIEETTFWVVGACNYIITSFFVLLFLYFLLKNRFSWWMIILSIIAGCSNENTCLAIIYTMSVLLLISRSEKINSASVDIDLNKKFFLICFALFIIGALILLLAPGNFERIQSETYRKWCELSLTEKFFEFIDRSQQNLPRTGEAWKVFASFLIMATISWRKNRKEIVISLERNKRELAWSLLFFSTALVSHFVMISSPYFPDRSLNPTLCFLLLSSSFLLDPEIFQPKILKLIFTAIVVWILWLFVKFFAILYTGHQSIMVQDAIRIDHIKYMIEKKGDHHITVDIPQHYISQILRRYRISFMFEFIPYGMEATWNGVNELNHIPVKYDYAVLRTGKPIQINNRSNLKNLKFYFQQKSLSSPQNTIVIESLEPINEDLILQYISQKTKKIQRIELDKKVIELQGKYYQGLTTEDDFTPKEIILKTSGPN